VPDALIDARARRSEQPAKRSEAFGLPVDDGQPVVALDEPPQLVVVAGVATGAAESDDQMELFG
jgi:hypothetical protein